MYKENLNRKEFLPVLQSYGYEAIKPLIKRAERISFKPYSHSEALNLLPDLKKYFYVYKENLEKFAPFVPNLKKKENPDDFFHLEIRNYLTNKIGCLITSSLLNEKQREIANKGKELIGKLYKKTGVSWNAIYSFWLNYLKPLCPNKKEYEKEFQIFQIKLDPFAILLNFAEKRTLPRTDHEQFFVDIPTLFNENDKDDYFWGCWSPEKEKSLIYGHTDGQTCLQREPLENGCLIIHNKINA